MRINLRSSMTPFKMSGDVRQPKQHALLLVMSVQRNMAVFDFERMRELLCIYNFNFLELI